MNKETIKKMAREFAEELLPVACVPFIAALALFVPLMLMMLAVEYLLADSNGALLRGLIVLLCIFIVVRKIKHL